MKQCLFPLKVSLILHTCELKEITEKLKLNGEQSGWSPVGSLVGRRGSVVGRICGIGVF